MAETRKDRRAPLSLKVRFKSATVDEFIEQYSNDISRGGIFIKSKSPMTVGTLLKFEFQLKDESRIIHGVGRVVWTRPATDNADPAHPPGMGIKFIKMDPESQSMVESIVSARGDTSGEFESKSVPPGATSFFPSKTGGDAPPQEEDRTQIRQASEFLASALKDTDPEAAREAEAQARGEGAKPLSDPAPERRSSAPPAAKGAGRDRDATPTSKRPLPPSASARPSAGPQPLQRGNEKPAKPFPLPVFLAVLAILAAGLYFVVGRSSGPPAVSEGASGQGVDYAHVSTDGVARAPTEPVPGVTPGLPTDGGSAADAARGAAGDAGTAPADAASEAAPARLVEVAFLSNVRETTYTFLGKDQGAGPSFELPENGEVEVTARAPGHADATQTVKVGSKRSITRFVLKRLPYVLEVVTVPPGATVFAGMHKLVAPGTVTLPNPRAMTPVTAMLNGHRRATTQVATKDFTQGDGKMVHRIELTLEPVTTGSVRPPAPRAPAKPRKPVGGDESGMPPPVDLQGTEAPKTAPPATDAPKTEAPKTEAPPAEPPAATTTPNP